MNMIRNNWLAGVLLLSGLTACTGGLEDANVDPNKMLVGDVNPYGMFEPLLYNGGTTWQNYTWYWNDELIQFTAFTGGVTREEHRYKISDGDWKSVWNKYSGFAGNAVHMYDLAAQRDDKAVEAVALTLKVLNMYNLTDMHGDIPYSEAFQARTPGGTTKPKFDSQADVYRQMFAELETANKLYAESPVFQKPELDGMYKGNMKAWQKFNNSLYLRLLCRVSGRSEMNVGQKMTEILANPATYPVFTSNADNAVVNFSGIKPYASYFDAMNEGNFTTSGRKLTTQLIKMTVVTEDNLQVYEDPRLAIYGRKNPNATIEVNKVKINIWKGTVGGCTREEMNSVDAGAAFLNFGVLCRSNAPATFMDFAEVQFIYAEAALKGLISGGETKAKSYYEAAVKASLEKWGGVGSLSLTPVTITEADMTTFLNSKLASWENAINKQELLGNQKFLALFWVGMEAYHEYRRTGYPELTIGAGTDYNDFQFPARFGYSSVTLATNHANAEAALERMGGANDMKTPVWWSLKAINNSK